MAHSNPIDPVRSFAQQKAAVLSRLFVSVGLVTGVGSSLAADAVPAPAPIAASAAGSAPVPVLSPAILDAQAKVKVRASARWQALLKRDFKADYGFTTPAYRKTTTQGKHASSYGADLKWLSAEVLSVRCDSADKCTARVKIEVTPPAAFRGAGNIVSGVDEVWLKENGQWWHYRPN